MSTIYSAGQFDDAFTPRKLGNWEAGAKEAYPYTKSPKELLTVAGPSRTEIIVNSRGHLLPWIPRDKLSSWGMLNYYIQPNYETKLPKNMTTMTGPGRQPEVPKKSKLPKFTPKKCSLPEPSHQDLLLEYLQELSRPIIWIIGPATKYTFQKRKDFTKQLASNLGFGYINLDDKIQEWKERQTTSRTQNHSEEAPSDIGANLPHIGDTRNLVATSVAPFKLPTNVPLCVSSKITSASPPSSSSSQSHLNHTMLIKIIESERITFDTALPLARTKILQLYKFAMMESLPCDGFVFDYVPFDLVEGLAFEKIFYPAALAIYFTDGVQHKKKKLKPKDRRVTANTGDLEQPISTSSSKKILISPLEYIERCKKASEHAFLRVRHHKRLGTFSIAEGEKICKQFGSKIIRIINAEEVGRDTMDFLFELVKRNLGKYKQIINGQDKLDCRSDWPHIFQSGSGMSITSTSSTAPGRGDTFSTGGDEELNLRNLIPTDPRRRRIVQQDLHTTEGVANMPPPLVTAHNSETSLFTLPNIFKTESESSLSSTTHEDESSPEEKWSSSVTEKLKTPPAYVDHGGAGDGMRTIARQKSADIWDKISRLESKVAGLNPESSSSMTSLQSLDRYNKRLPPPTAYTNTEEDEEERLTTAIKHAMVANLYAKEFLPVHTPYPVYDYGASGDGRSSDTTTSNDAIHQNKKESRFRDQRSPQRVTDNKE